MLQQLHFVGTIVAVYKSAYFQDFKRSFLAFKNKHCTLKTATTVNINSNKLRKQQDNLISYQW